MYYYQCFKGLEPYYSFEALGTAYKKLKILCSFNNTTVNKRIQKDLAS